MKKLIIKIKQPALKALFIGAVFILFSFSFKIGLAHATQFYVDSTYQPQGQNKIEATLKYAATHAYFYVEDQWFNALASNEQEEANRAILNLGSQFDQIIYLRETAIFGSEWNPGIDNDSKINVLLTEMVQAPGGYFRPEDEYATQNAAYSNQREMVYLNTLYLTDTKEPAYLAHEFQHLITFNQKNRLRNIDDEVWINEARSQYAITLCGYNDVYRDSDLEKRVNHFLSQPSDSLTNWQNNAYDYASVTMFVHYLVSHYGQSILTQIIQSDKTGIASVNAALNSMGYTETFADVFTNWLVANLVNNCELGVGQVYCYLSSNLNYNNLHIAFGDVAGPAVNSASFTRLAQNWAGDWHRFSAQPRDYQAFLNLQFSVSLEKGFQVVYVVTDKDGRQRINFMGLDLGRGSLNFNDFGTKITQIDLIVSQQPESDLSNFLSLKPFTISVAVQNNSYGSLAEDSLVLAQNGKVYLLRDGQKQWINSATIFESRYQWSDVKSITDGDLAVYQEGALINTLADGILVRPVNQDKVYVISGGQRRWISSAQVFMALGYQWNKIIAVSDNDLSHHSYGLAITDSSIHPEGSLIKGSGPVVYLVQNSTKRAIKSVEVFNDSNFKWDRIITVSDQEIGQYGNGAIVI